MDDQSAGATNRGGSGRDLDAGRIAEAALELIDRQGLAGLTMRRLAEACGSTPMTLYRHVRDRAELERLVAERVLERVPPARPLADWRDGVGELMGGLRGTVLRSPGPGRLVLSCWPALRGRSRIMDQLYGVLLSAGYKGPDVVIAADAIELYVMGAIAHDLADAPVTGRLAHVGVELTPHLVEFAAYLVKRDADVMYASGLDVVIRGLEETLGPAAGRGGA